MKEKLLSFLWSVSLMLISASTIITSVSNILNYPLPDLVIRLLGVVQLLSVASLTYSTVKKFTGKQESKS